MVRENTYVMIVKKKKVLKTKSKSMKNELREARWYKLAFKNNLQLTEVDGKVGLLGSNKDFKDFWKGLSESLEDKYWRKYAINNEDYNGLERYLENSLPQEALDYI